MPLSDFPPKPRPTAHETLIQIADVLSRDQDWSSGTSGDIAAIVQRYYGEDSMTCSFMRGPGRCGYTKRPDLPYCPTHMDQAEAIARTIGYVKPVATVSNPATPTD